MKVLWFTETPSLYKNEKTFYNGRGWIESLEQLIRKSGDIELGISFIHRTDKAKQKRDTVTYYPIIRKRGKIINRISNKLFYKIESVNYKSEFLEVINDFKPDVIHVWGTESTLTEMQSYTKIPVVIHLQGLINGYNFAFYPPGINKFQFLFSPLFFKNHILRNSPIFVKKGFERQALRECSYFKNAKYIMGRTNWDKSISTILAPQATYFHVDEVLRTPFYCNEEYLLKQQNKVIIISTISSTIYKGIDLILKTAKLLKQNTTLLFEWHIVGLNSDNKLLRFFEKHLKISCKDFNIIIEGEKGSLELVALMRDASIFVHPSYIDNSPNSVCEAQMLGLPVIACNVGGLSTLIENNINGILIPANAPFELVNAIKTLAMDNNLSYSIGKQAKLTAMKRHNREKIIADILHVYKILSGL